MKVRLSKRTPDKVDFAMVIAHELAHTRGARDEYMMRHSARYGRFGSYRQIYAWANELPLEVRPKVTTTRPAPDAKLAHCQRMLKAALTREKRATTLRKKWETRVRYYAKKIATVEVQDEQAIAA
jgi:predicted metal-dependent hydrolase